MGKIRSAKAEFWTDAKMGTLPRDVRFTFKGIWEVMADDEGRFLADPRLIKGQVWPLDDDITVKKVAAWLRILADRGRVVLYFVEGAAYGAIPSWHDHQRISHRTASKLPPPPSVSSADFRKSSGDHRSGAGASPEHFRPDKEKDGEREMDRSGADARASSLAPDPDPLNVQPPHAPPAPLVELPPAARLLLDTFFDPHLVTERRRTDAACQLYDTLDPRKKKGARLERGQHVKAIDAAHLDRCCQAVLDDPPRDQALAVRFVLLKLRDPIPGPPQTEVMARAQQAAEALDDEYCRAAKDAGLQWAREHPDEFAQLRKPIDAEFRGAMDSMTGRMAHTAALTSKCARAAGFPDFDTWLTQRNGPRASRSPPTADLIGAIASPA